MDGASNQWDLPSLNALLSAVGDFESALNRAAGGLVDPYDSVDQVLQTRQSACHAYAWYSAYVKAITTAIDWVRNLHSSNRARSIDPLLFAVGTGRYLSDLVYGFPISATETIRPTRLGLSEAAADLARNPDVAHLMAMAETDGAVAELVSLLSADAETGDAGTLMQDETLDLVRTQFRRVTAEEVTPHAGHWHDGNLLIPDETMQRLGEMGAFGLTIPESYGGSGLGLEAQCVVTEELSRGFLGVGSLGTRSEIAGTLIVSGGTEEQKQKYLPGIASGAILPTAVFTEPNAGSDLGSIATRARRDGDVYRVTGAKTWITHAARADIMMLLARTNPDRPGYGGLSMFIAEKPRGTADDPFPATGMSGSEIEVIGYRGMKEYELAFDGFEIPVAGLLGGQEEQGFRQLMATFESARIQTAARAVGVAHSALDAALRYASDRHQFKKPLISFQRVANKLANIAAETMLVRQLVYAAARKKENGTRCDIEAGMAKLLGARLAWDAADDALQIHGGNGYSTEYQISRILCDARILNIFEGAAEIQAQVVAKGLLSTSRN